LKVFLITGILILSANEKQGSAARQVLILSVDEKQGSAARQVLILSVDEKQGSVSKAKYVTDSLPKIREKRN
jgi:hypothetical protein